MSQEHSATAVFSAFQEYLNEDQAIREVCGPGFVNFTIYRSHLSSRFRISNNMLIYSGLSKP